MAAALPQGRSIDMPVTLADVAPRLRNLGSAAFRRSNLGTQEEIARLLTERSRGQAGRAQGQLEASFGPLDDPVQASRTLMERSEERRVGKECVSTCRSRWSPYH